MTFRRPFFEYVVDAIAHFLTKKIVHRSVNNSPFGKLLIIPISDPIGLRIISTGKYESTQIDAIEEVLRNARSVLGIDINFHGSFVDVGANIGLFSLKFAPFFDKCFAIEAHPSTFSVLKANILLSRLDNTTPICVAASNHDDGRAKLNVNVDGVLGWSSINPAGDAASQIDVTTYTLDRIMSDCSAGRVALIKIDVEGHELEVIHGARNILRNSRPVVLFEALSNDHAQKLVAALLELGYQRFFTFERRFTSASLIRGVPLRVIEHDPNNVQSSAMICAVPNPQ
jgi:FkbM family methyltransferase